MMTISQIPSLDHLDPHAIGSAATQPGESEEPEDSEDPGEVEEAEDPGVPEECGEPEQAEDTE